MPIPRIPLRSMRGLTQYRPAGFDKIVDLLDLLEIFLSEKVSFIFGIIPFI